MVSEAVQSRPRAATTGGWSRAYARRLLITDLLVILWVVFGVQIAWLGLDSHVSTNQNDLRVGYTAVSVVVTLVWLGGLAYYGTRGDRVIGVGSAEYRLVADSSARVFGLLAIAAYLLHVQLARGYVLIAFPLGIIVLILSRWMWRQWLGMKRQDGEYVARLLLVGSAASAAHLAQQLRRHRAEGYLVVGACVPGGLVEGKLGDTGIPVLGDLDDVLRVLEEVGADAVAVTSSDELTPERVRRLGWELERGQQGLIVAPSLTDIGGPRLHTRPVAGLPLIHVEVPRYEGRKLIMKRLFDIFGSSVLIVLLSPILLALALLVAGTSEGPVLYRQERIGLAGAPFNMLKFRSMHPDADAQLASLLAAQGKGDKPLFKVHADPRVTPVGRVLRKYSLDELPQLINVLQGEMSLVGPRPQRQGEVALYDDAARRRLLLKPGMSGLWQVGGRSSLSWEDAIRLDLYYVENWSLTGDILILWRTIRAVIAPGNEAV